MTDAARPKTGGREAGTRNRRTQALLDLAESGETPCAFALRIMRDDTKDELLRMQAAKLAAPFVHAKPNPEPRLVAFDLPEVFEDAADLLQVHTGILRAVATGELGLEDARELSSIIETQRRLHDTADLEKRIAALEQRQP